MVVVWVVCGVCGVCDRDNDIIELKIDIRPEVELTEVKCHRKLVNRVLISKMSEKKLTPVTSVNKLTSETRVGLQQKVGQRGLDKAGTY